MARACANRRSPAGVAATPALPRTSKGCPARSSSLRICSLTDDWDRNTFGAAAVRLPESSTATSVRNWSRSNPDMAHPTEYTMDKIVNSRFSDVNRVPTLASHFPNQEPLMPHIVVHLSGQSDPAVNRRVVDSVAGLTHTSRMTCGSSAAARCPNWARTPSTWTSGSPTRPIPRPRRRASSRRSMRRSRRSWANCTNALMCT
ncbi:hypothetical protein G6F65_020205 [Rhizopus arrhizus]|nr:hypothetical protein G6F65_020205 [Rhizopus arrhizus]